MSQSNTSTSWAGVHWVPGGTLSLIHICPCSAVVVLHQGVYHQIKRMFGVYGAGVRELRRVAIGQLWLDERLGPGGWRELTAEEVEKITAGRLQTFRCV